MEFNTQDYLKKALLEAQERVRDYNQYADQMPERELKSFFKNYAQIEGLQAQKLRQFIGRNDRS